jgi:acyl carrier protein
MNDLKLQVKILMNKVLNVELNFDELTQSNIPNWDSVNHLNLIIEFENNFLIDIEPEEIVKMDDFNNIYEILSKKIKT